MTAFITPSAKRSSGRVYWIVALAIFGWLAAYSLIQPLSHCLS
jgi:hypothetical protein